MQYLSHSEAGHAHLNEDCVAVTRHPRDADGDADGDADALICVLADGQGGQFGGGVAARAAVEQCLSLASSHGAGQLLERAVWRAILSRADEAVERQSDAGFTTLIGLCVTPTQICGASCGDSAALLIEGGQFVELTGLQRKNPPVGSGVAMPATFGMARSAGSTLLLMSDGVWKFVGFDVIAAVARAQTREQSGADLVWELRALQLSGNGAKLPDDFSVIVAS